ncbi:MAG: hypothetical protein KDC39_15855 [Actinobacteria bacterium]|nr:hypothetical protein [Actinomycetota bacterium]
MGLAVRVGRVGVAALVPVVLVAGMAVAGEPKPPRDKDLGISCEVDDAFNGVVNARASSFIRTKDMKNNNGAKVPMFYRLKAKIEIQRWKSDEQWHTMDNHDFETVWVERRGQWIVKKAQQPPYTKRNAQRGFWSLRFGDSTKLANPGEYVIAKYTVWLDKKPGGKVWKYERYSNYVLCPSEPGEKTVADPKPRKRAKNPSTPPGSASNPGSGSGGGMTGGEVTPPNGELPTGRGGK